MLNKPLQAVWCGDKGQPSEKTFTSDISGSFEEGVLSPWFGPRPDGLNGTMINAIRIKHLTMWTWPIQKPLENYVYKNVSLLVHVCVSSTSYLLARWHCVRSRAGFVPRLMTTWKPLLSSWINQEHPHVVSDDDHNHDGEDNDDVDNGDGDRSKKSRDAMLNYSESWISTFLKIIHQNWKFWWLKRFLCRVSTLTDMIPIKRVFFSPWKQSTFIIMVNIQILIVIKVNMKILIVNMA